MNNIEQLQSIIEQQNAAPQDDFDGFSPTEMSIILYAPFSSKCPIPIRSPIEAKYLHQSPIFQIASHILKAIKDDDGIKLTARGNLPPQLVNEIYAKKYISDPLIEAGISKLNQESKWDILHTTKIVLKLAKLIRTYKGKLLLTTQAQKLLTNQEEAKLFHLFFKTFTTEFNWAYNDAFEDEEIGQIGFLYLLYLIHKYGRDNKELSFYSKLYLKAFPVFEEHTTSRFPDHCSSILKVRFFTRFAEWFGLVEMKRKSVIEVVGCRRTKLLSHLLM